MFMFFSKVLFRHTRQWLAESQYACSTCPSWKSLVDSVTTGFLRIDSSLCFLVSSVIVTKSRLCVYVLLRELHTGSEKERCLFCLLKEECLYHKLEPDFGEICMYCCWGHSLMSSASKQSLNGIMHSQNHSDAPLLIWLHAFRFVLKS